MSYKPLLGDLQTMELKTLPVLGLTLIILLMSSNCAYGNRHQKVNVSVYYETLCFPSVRLIQRQIYPVWWELQDYLNISFVPYGKAVHNKDAEGRWTFDCQHGPRECYGNKIQACALNLLRNNTPDSRMEFIRCFMTYRNFYPYNQTTCFEDVVGANSSEIIAKLDQCVKTEEGDHIMAQLGDMTYAVTPSITSVPTVTFNGVHDLHLQSQAERDFRSVICNLLNPAPAPCTAPPKRENLIS